MLFESMFSLWVSSKVMALFLGSSLLIFIILSCRNSGKLNFSLLLKCFLIFLIDWFLNCLSRCWFVFQSWICLFEFQSFSQIRKMLIQSGWYLLDVVDNSLIFTKNDSVCGFTFIGKEELDFYPEFVDPEC